MNSFLVVLNEKMSLIMGKYKVFLSRTYIVTIQSKNKEDACKNVEFYLGDCLDLSLENDQVQDNFLIEEIKPAENEAFFAEEVKEENDN